MEVEAVPEKQIYRPGEVMTVWAKIKGAPVPFDAVLVLKGMGYEWRAGPIRDLQPPTIVRLAVQVPGCTVVPGRTVTGYPIACKGTVPGGKRTFTLEVRDKYGRLLGTATFAVTILGPTAKQGATAQAEAQEGGNVPWWLIAGAMLLLLS